MKRLVLTPEEAETLEMVIEKERDREHIHTGGYIWEVCVPQACWGVAAEGRADSFEDAVFWAKTAMDNLRNQG